ASDAHAPAGETRLSLPSYIIGDYVSETDRRPDGDLDLFLRDSGNIIQWGRAESVFSRAKALGFKTALAGWYLPYCRLIGDQLDFCSSEVYESVVPATETSVWSRIGAQLNAVDPFNGREQHITRQRHILHAAEVLSSDPKYDLVFVHWPVPHYPPIFNARTHHFTLTQYSSTTGYFENLALVDDTLADIRSAMERSHVWDATTFIVTSDHPPTDAGVSDDSCVPFVVKFAGQSREVAIDATLNTVIIADMCLAIFRNEIGDPGALKTWLLARSQKVK